MLIKNVVAPAIILFAFFSVSCAGGSSKKPPAVQNGKIDVSGWDFYNDGYIPLDGNWEFYWNRLLGPGDFTHKNPALTPTGFFPVPGVWKDYNGGGKSFPPHGYATYRLLIRNADTRLLFGMIVPDTGTADKVFINGRTITSSGIVGTSSKRSEPQYRNRYACFRTEQPDIELIVQVSNFHYWKGGLWNTILLGEAQAVSAEEMTRAATDLILMGAVAVIAIYSLTLFILIGKDPASIYFSLFCLLTVFRIGATGYILFTHVFPNFNWELLIKLEICPFYLGVFLFTKYIFCIFPEIIPQILVKVSTYYMIIFMLILIAAPAVLYSNLILPTQVLVIGFTLTELILLIKGLLKQIKGTFIVLSGLLFLFLTVVNDVLFSNKVIQTVYLFPLGVLVFFFSQSFIISLRTFKELKFNSQVLFSPEGNNMFNPADRRRMEIKD